MFPKRPKRGEDDDDLQKYQEDFLRGNAGVPSAKVVRVNNSSSTPAKTDHGTPAVTPYKTSAEELKSEKVSVEDVPEDPSQESELLTRVVERSNVSAFLSSVSISQPSVVTGFPEVPKLSTELLRSSTPSRSPKKKSLFMQQVEAKKLNKRKADTPSCSTDETSATGTAEETSLNLPNTMDEISKENEQKIAQMSAEEILAEQRQLAQTLDPALLQLLKNRKSKTVQTSAINQSAVADDVEMADAGSDRQGAGSVVKDTVTPLKGEDLPFQPDVNWLHMDQLEHNKLQWLKPLDDNSKQQKDKKSKLSARFDFNGNLINPDLDIGISSGLHHHGEEPHSAGYTLEELFVLVRSLNTSQKTLALSTISHVLRKAKHGNYLYLLNNSITKSLLEADIVLLLRYALDERSDLVLAAAVNCWHSLLCSTHDMEALNRMNCSLYGHIVPQLAPNDPSPPETEEEQIEREEEQYIEVLKRDVISGLLLMDFLPRLRYILEVVKPQKIVCSQIFDVICRMVMTSSEIAYKVYRTPRLVSAIFELFLPMSFTIDPDETGLGRPIVEAMRCVRYLCASGKNMAAKLIAEHSLMDRIARYISSDDSSEFGESYQLLMVESLLTWRSLLLYGLALNHYHILRAGLLTRLQHETDPLIASSIICVLSAFLSASTEQPAKSVRFSDLPPGGDVSDLSPQLQWTQVAGLIDSVYGLCVTQMTYFINTYSHQHSNFGLDVLISSLDFVSLYLKHTRVQSVNLECAVTADTIAADMAGLVEQLLISTAFNKLLTGVRKSSILLRELGYLTTETTPNLPSLYTVEKLSNLEDADSNRTAACTDISQLLVLKGLIQLLACTLKVSPATIKPLCKQLLEHTEVSTYVHQIGQSSLSNSENFLSLVECSTMVELCQLAAAVPTSRIREYHRCSLSVVPKCTGSLLADLYTLFSQVVFDPTVFRSCGVSEDDVIIDECMKSLPSIANTYVSLSLPMGEQLQKSRNLKERNTTQTRTLQVRHIAADLLPADWPFMPIMHLYQTSNSRDSEAKLPPDTCLLLKNSLQFVYMLEKCHPDVIKSIGTHAKIARIMCSFLLDNDLFLEPVMQSLLSTLLTSYCQHIRYINFNQPIPGLYSFNDLYAAFIDQFEAASFGNNVFSQFLLLPMMQQQCVDYRKLVWTEHALTLRSIFLKPHELVFPVTDALYPEETNSTIIMRMCRHLLSGTVTLGRNHLLYVIALHHVNRFMFTTDGKSTEIKQSLLKYAQQCTVEPLKEHLIFYKEYVVPSTDSGGKDGIVCYDKLPASRCQTLKSVQAT